MVTRRRMILVRRHIGIAQHYAECISLLDHTTVQVRAVANLPKATLVTIEPYTEDDWKILELNSEYAEKAILKQGIKKIASIPRAWLWEERETRLLEDCINFNKLAT